MIVTGRSSGKIDAEEQAEAGAAVDHRRLVELAGDRRHEGPEQDDAERGEVGDLDEHEPPQRVEQVDLLQDVDRRHDGRRDDQPGEHGGVDERGHPVAAPLEHEPGHRAEDHEQGHGHDGHDEAVAHRRDEQVVAGRHDLLEVLPHVPRRRPREVEPGRLGAVLDGGQGDEGERDDEHDEHDAERHGVEPVARISLMTSAPACAGTSSTGRRWR